MLLTISQFGGILPKIKDPLLLPEGKSQEALNCRFDHGGIEALLNDLTVSTPSNPGIILSIFLYQFVNKFLAWSSDVKALTAPLANDAQHRVFYTESGRLKVTDHTLYDQGGTDYPMAWRYASPPAPSNALGVTSAVAVTGQIFIGKISLDSLGVFVQEKAGTVAGVGSISPLSQIKIIGTGIAVLDGKTFSFTEAKTYPISSGTEGFYLVGVSALSSGSILSVSKASVGSVVSTKHGLLTGDHITIASVGMTQLNNVTFTVTVVDVDTFTIGVNTTAYSDFLGGSWSLISRDYSAFVTPRGIDVTPDGCNITKASPAQMTVPALGLVTGNAITFSNMVGMTELEGVTVSVTVLDVNTCTLDGIDSTTYGTFVSGQFTVGQSFSIPLDPTLQETVYYVETLVNSYGSEGPPSIASNLIDIYDGDKVSISDPNTSADPLYGIVSKNIYRANKDASGNEILQYQQNVPLANQPADDTTLAAALGEVLPSTLWDGPPLGAEGLVALANQTLAAFSGNLFLMSEPNYPHAWPVTYQKPTDTPIMGIGAFGSSALILTQGVPYLSTGNTPANSVMDKLGIGFGCVSKRSVVQVGDIVIYSSTDGLAGMGTNSAAILTDNIISPEQWRASYAPTSISGYFWEGKYVGFYNNAAGFILDPKTGDFVSLDFYATAGYHDPVSGTLYLVVAGTIVAFVGGTTLRTMNAVTKQYSFKQSSPGVVKILATDYPVTVDVTYYGFDSTGNPVNQTVSLTAISPEPFRHPPVGLVGQCDVRVQNGLTAIYLAGTFTDLPT